METNFPILCLSISLAQQSSASPWPKGSPPTTRKAKNKAWNAILPPSNEGICRSYANFTRFLLGYTTENPKYPASPTEDEIQNLPLLLSRDQILRDQSIFSTSTSLQTNVNNKDDWKPFKALILSDLANVGVGRFTFDWASDSGENSHWNEVMISFTVKHWNFAKRSSAFFSYAVDIKWDLEVYHFGLLARWLCGRIEEIKQKFHEPHKLYGYRKKTATLYLEDHLYLLPSPDCCSDTEIDPDGPSQRSIRPFWRSDQYGDWLHQLDQLSYRHQKSVKGRLKATRRFDTCRQKGYTSNPLAPVCKGLPENCYTQEFMTSLGDLSRKTLDIKLSSICLDKATKDLEKFLA